MVLRHLESPHGLQEGILKKYYTKEEGDKGVEGSLKACNNLVVNVGRRGRIYVKFPSLKPKLVLGEYLKMSQLLKLRVEICIRLHVPTFHKFVKFCFIFHLKDKENVVNVLWSRWF